MYVCPSYQKQNKKPPSQCNVVSNGLTYHYTASEEKDGGFESGLVLKFFGIYVRNVL